MFVAIGLLDDIIDPPNDADIGKGAKLNIILFRLVLVNRVEKSNQPFLKEVFKIEKASVVVADDILHHRDILCYKPFLSPLFTFTNPPNQIHVDALIQVYPSCLSHTSTCCVTSMYMPEGVAYDWRLVFKSEE